MTTKNIVQMQVGTQLKGQLSQRLIMSAHMQQALRMLQLPLQELEPYIEEQVASNPLLEIENDSDDLPIEDLDLPSHQGEEEKEITISDKDLEILKHLDEDFRDHFEQNEPMTLKRSSDEDKFKTYLEQSICVQSSLQKQLIDQARDSFESEEDMNISEIVIGYIDEYGFLKTPISEICSLHCVEEKKVEKIIAVIQTFEPYGVGAATIQESLLIQLRCLHKEDHIAFQIIRDYYEELLHNQIPQIQKKMNCSYEAIQEAIEKDIAKLDLHPGTHFSSHSAQVIIPDVTLRQEEDKIFVEVDRDYTPSLRLNSRYLKLLNDPDVPLETKRFVKHHLFSARWLMRNLQQRFSTLERIMQVLAEKQYEFFMNPQGVLVPLVMKTLAEELNVHESTIARTVANKYINSPRGIFPLRAFFTNKYVTDEGEDISSSTVKQAILKLIEHENKNLPLSDHKISLLLKEQGISCARRTVAKYRFILKIGNTQQRKKFQSA